MGITTGGSSPSSIRLIPKFNFLKHFSGYFPQKFSLVPLVNRFCIHFSHFHTYHFNILLHIFKFCLLFRITYVLNT
eukprot:UN16917